MVKTAYHLLVENFHTEPIPGAVRPEKSFWNRFWKLRVPQRAKHFAWRLLTDSLPTSVNLRARTMDVAITCPLCQEEDGSTAHLFFDCSFSKRLWSIAGLHQVIETSRRARGDFWFHELLQSNAPETAELILMYCDSLWFQRNQRTFTDHKLEAEYLAMSVSSHLRTFHDANGWPERLCEALLDKALVGPPRDCPRILFDAGIREGKAGLGAIAIDSTGTFIRAMADCVPGVTDPLLAEGLTMALAVELANDMKLESAVIVGDCLNLIRMIRGDSDVPLGYTDLLARLHSLLASGGLDNPCWIPGDQNRLAHSLARYAKENLSGRSAWNTQPPFLLSNDVGRFQ